MDRQRLDAPDGPGTAGSIRAAGNGSRALPASSTRNASGIRRAIWRSARISSRSWRKACAPTAATSVSSLAGQLLPDADEREPRECR